jgi:hyperosmotically inducible protein
MKLARGLQLQHLEAGPSSGHSSKMGGSKMEKHLRFGSAVLVSLALLLAPALLSADQPDSWITTKAKIKLLTTKGVSGKSVGVDTDHGKVTLHGKVPTRAAKAKAEAVVREIGGVRAVDNQLQVVPASLRKAVEASDDEIKSAIHDRLKANNLDVKVSSVNKGVVILSGETATMAEELQAIQTAIEVDGVREVTSEIKTKEAGEDN